MSNELRVKLSAVAGAAMRAKSASVMNKAQAVDVLVLELLALLVELVERVELLTERECDSASNE